MELTAERCSAERPRGAWLFAVPGAALFFSMVFLPTAAPLLKALLLGLALAVVAGEALVGARPRLDRSTFLWIVGLAGLGLAFLLRGLLFGEPGALRVGTVYVLWPLAWAVLIAGALSERALRAQLALFVLALAAVSLYGLEFVLEQSGWLGTSLFPDLFEDQGIGFYEGFVELRLPALASLPFGLPFLIAAGMTWGGSGRAPVARPYLWGTLVLGLLLAALSGRRAVLFVVALAPFLTVGTALLLPAAERRRVFGPALLAIGALALLAVVVGAFLGASLGFDAGVLWESFREGFDPSASLASSIRGEQLQGLVAGWSEHPLLGRGHGAFLRDHVRDPERPWAYELSYAALLFQTGLVGFLAYAGFVGWLFWQALLAVRRGGYEARVMLPLTVGLAAFLVANATNPYLLKFDFLWTLFMPLAFLNRFQLARTGTAAPLPRHP
jgi:hypothetical protein